VTDVSFRGSDKYEGRELPLFEKCENWKRSWISQIEPYLKGNILEVGGGIVANTRMLVGKSVTGVTILELLDPDNCAAIQCRFDKDPPAVPHSIRLGTIDSLDEGLAFDSIVYTDVLEHIKDDDVEIGQATRRLRPGGF